MMASNPEKSRSFRNKFGEVNGLKNIIKDLKGPTLYRDIFAELLTTFFLNLAITSLVVQFPEGASALRASLAIGFGVLVLVEGFGHFGDANINPAVTFALMTLCEISLFKGL